MKKSATKRKISNKGRKKSVTKRKSITKRKKSATKKKISNKGRKKSVRKRKSVTKKKKSATKKKIGGEANDYISIYDEKISELRRKYKNVKMCCDKKEELKSLLKDIQELTETNGIQENLPKIYKHLNDTLENVQRAEMMKNLLRIFIDEDYYSRKERKEKVKKYLKKTKKIKFKECPDLGEEISSNYSIKFYEHKTKPKIFIKEKVITNYNTVSDGTNFRQISSILDEIDIFDRFKDKKFTSKLFDYYVCEKDDDIVLYMEIEKKGTILSKWLEDNVLTDKDKSSILELMKMLHKLNIIYNNGYDTDNLLIDEKGDKRKFYLTSFEKAETKDHIFERFKKIDLEDLSGTLEWSTPYDSNELKALIICDINVIFTL